MKVNTPKLLYSTSYLMAVKQLNASLCVNGSRSFLFCAVILTFCLNSSVKANDYFNPAALEMKDQSQLAVDINEFAKEDGQVPGVYRVDIYVNGTQVETRDVKFISEKGKLIAEITPAELEVLGVRILAFSQLKRLSPSEPISDLDIPDAYSILDFSQLRLNISIPQAALTSNARDYVDPKFWDQGISALLLNYNLSASNTWYEKRSGSEETSFLNLQSGVNMGVWRLRNYSTYSYNNNWGSISTYLQRDIQILKSQLTLGKSYTPGDVFESLHFRGAQLSSDDNMYPDSQRGYAPVIRGIAQSNAQVSIRQKGYVIYQTYVAPGAFEITDLFPTSNSGDLEVVIKEADGSERVSIQPFSAVPIMQREGRLKYALTGGEFRSSTINGRQPGFLQGTAIYGLPLSTSVYAGNITANNYKSALLGVGHGFGEWGSLSVDATYALTRLQGSSERHQGQSYRFQYSKDINSTGTTFTLAGYRYSTSGYYDFKESNEIRVTSNATDFDVFRLTNNKRSRAQFNINQSVFDWGSFYVSGFQQDYWGRSGYERSLNTGWNSTVNSISYGLSYSYNQLPGAQANDKIMAFNISVPLSKWLTNSWATYGIDNNQQGKTNQRVGLSGTALEDNNLFYNIQESYANKGVGNGGNASATYNSTYGQINGAYSYNSDSRRLNYGLHGGIVAHPYGVTFSQPLGDTATLVRAPGASGVKLQNKNGVKTDWRGYTVVPYVSTYRKNRIALDTNSLGEDVDIDTVSQTVIPTNGALVLADFQTRVGQRVLMGLTYSDKPVPFGATASLVQKLGALPNTGIVGENGEVYLSGMPQTGQLKIVWGKTDAQQCNTNFVLPEKSETSVVNISAVCR